MSLNRFVTVWSWMFGSVVLVCWCREITVLIVVVVFGEIRFWTVVVVCEIRLLCCIKWLGTCVWCCEICGLFVLCDLFWLFLQVWVCGCVVLFVRSCSFLSSLAVQTGCIYKRGTLATKGVSLGHQGFDK